MLYGVLVLVLVGSGILRLTLLELLFLLLLLFSCFGCVSF